MSDVKRKPMCLDDKPQPGYSPIYAAMYPEMVAIARRYGYALAIHGSMRRDFDVIAIPWTDVTGKPSELVSELVRTFDMKQVGEPGPKPHGRIAYTLSIGFGECFVDLSFMPTAASDEQHVAWLHYQRTDSGAVVVKVCDSDSKGAFKVYRHSKESAQ